MTKSSTAKTPCLIRVETGFIDEAGDFTIEDTAEVDISMKSVGDWLFKHCWWAMHNDKAVCLTSLPF